MKKSLLLIAALIYLANCHSQSPTKASDNFKKLDWLEGTWIRTNVKPGRSANERWIKVSATEWQGFGLNMKGQDTTLLEKLKLIIKDNTIYYVADVPENKQPVFFKLTEISENGFVCENPEHDFPKKISYQKEGNKLKATISGDGKSIDYFFEKK
ncbi:MAG TPA: DUF6265 family protein [Chitinophagaceae bacterium]|jgi:hypothetical protein|nr:DUF6265 family protein [Chitinophagaceae bacterium]